MSQTTPQRFQRRSATVEAMRVPFFMSDEAAYQAIEAWMESHELVMFERNLGGGFDIAIAGHWSQARPGDWIVLTTDNYLVPFTNAAFTAAYMPVEADDR